MLGRVEEDGIQQVLLQRLHDPVLENGVLEGLTVVVVEGLRDLRRSLELANEIDGERRVDVVLVA